MTAGGSRQAVSIDTVLADLRPSAYAFAMLGLCVLIGMVEGYDAQAMAFAAPLVAKAWVLPASTVGLLLATSIFGMVVGSFLLSPLGDRWGRRPSILLALLVAGLATVAGALVASAPALFATRFLAGFALGLAFPNVIALAMELMPARLRTLAIVLVSCGYPLGGAIGGITAASLISGFGYPAVFVLGGSATLIVMLVCAAFLPESPLFLARHGNHDGKLGRLVRRLGGGDHGGFAVDRPSTAPSLTSSVGALFESSRRTVTVLLWIINFANLLLVYYFVTWLPTILVNAGLTPKFGAGALSLISGTGMIGGLVLAFLLPRLGATRTLGGAYALATAGTATLAMFTTYGTPFLLVLGVGAMGIVGSQFCLNAVVNHAYPSEIRATASGYATGAGRVGAVLAPIAGATVSSFDASSQTAFGVAVLPALVALIGVLILGRRIA